MKLSPVSLKSAVTVQLLVLTAFAVSLASTSNPATRWLGAALKGTATTTAVPIARVQPLRIEPLYDDPSVVSNRDLLEVLRKTRPRFSARQLKPNFVEHALRTWGVDAEFADPTIMSGKEMRDFLLDHSRFINSWSAKTEPLLVSAEDGVAVHWGRKPHLSVHHDHLLASLTEAGIPLNQKVYPAGGSAAVFGDLLQRALRDFRLDEREVEWSAMAFGLWLAPSAKSWNIADGRRISFDQIARRLMRGHQRFGVCSGTHRVYSLTLLLRLDQHHDILSDPVQTEVFRHLRGVRDRLLESQFPDGHWPSNWSEGRKAVTSPIVDPDYKQVIATGHHLEWLAIAPASLQPPRERIRKAARWLVENVKSHSSEQILQRYTFYSHVASALALWRKTRPSDFWRLHAKTRSSHQPTPQVKLPGR
ncbi:MAG: hypothetical protein IID45_00075 [Planctomycetes bacterium]|nr:hypothetical protein [Planctomycetota bacterium]